ncbi:MAG: sulfotransferase [Actinomycetota bacterium]|nr:sulfotransferase [Actinomycetota bacterium]
MTELPAEPSGTAPRPVYLHLGAPKTGTTYLQAMLGAHRDRLLDDGCYYPATGTSAHHVEARDLRDARPRRYVHPSGPGSWDRLVRNVHDWQGQGIALISSELLVFTKPDQVERALRSLQPAEVHLVVTVRDLVRQIPAVWQETVKNGSTKGYDEFVRRLVEDEEGNGPRGLWNAQDPVRILDRWGQGIPPERVHLVTVPPPGSDPRLLWNRFAQVIGVDPENYPPVPQPANTSLGAAETEVVRRINAQVEKASWPFYSKHIKNGIAQGVLAGRSGGPRLLLPEEVLPLVERRTKRINETLAGRGYDIVGSLDDLLPGPDRRGVGPVPEPDAEQLAEAYALAAEYLARKFAVSWQRAQKQTGAGRAGRPAATQGPRPVTPGPAADLLRRGYRSLRRRLRG